MKKIKFHLILFWNKCSFLHYDHKLLLKLSKCNFLNASGICNFYTCKKLLYWKQSSIVRHFCPTSPMDPIFHIWAVVTCTKAWGKNQGDKWLFTNCQKNEPNLMLCLLSNHVTYIVQALLSIFAIWYVWCFSCLRSGICVICTFVLAITVRQWRGRGSGRRRQLGKTFYRRREEWHMVTVTSGSNLKHNTSRKLYCFAVFVLQHCTHKEINYCSSEALLTSPCLRIEDW